nr:PREDICTED: MANSC domain-containing protein 1 isoform X2 [Latimeria chalumnae]|eukprot:XP_014353462.1 PREDICTED: MANSC domain-containing protein 1 isoform X2 [Latimeria chalumnae]
MKMTWHVAVMLPLLLCVLPSPSAAEHCFTDQMEDVIIDIKAALPLGVRSREPLYTAAAEVCTNLCCDGVKINEKKCNLVIFDFRKHPQQDNCYLFHCPSAEACPMKTLKGLKSYRIRRDDESPSVEGADPLKSKPAGSYQDGIKLHIYTTPKSDQSDESSDMLQKNTSLFFHLMDKVEEPLGSYKETYEVSSAETKLEGNSSQYPMREMLPLEDHEEQPQPIAMATKVNAVFQMAIAMTSQPVAITATATTNHLLNKSRTITTSTTIGASKNTTEITAKPIMATTTVEPNATATGQSTTIATKIQLATMAQPVSTMKTQPTTTIATTQPMPTTKAQATTTVTTTTQPTTVIITTTITKPITSRTTKPIATSTTIATTQPLTTTVIVTTATSKITNVANKLEHNISSVSFRPDGKTTGQLNSWTDVGLNVNKWKTTDLRAGVRSGLITALLFGVLFLVLVVAVISKRMFESFNRRHYSRVDYLVNGMYVDI